MDHDPEDLIWNKPFPLQFGFVQCFISTNQTGTTSKSPQVIHQDPKGLDSSGRNNINTGC